MYNWWELLRQEDKIASLIARNNDLLFDVDNLKNNNEEISDENAELRRQNLLLEAKTTQFDKQPEEVESTDIAAFQIRQFATKLCKDDYELLDDYYQLISLKDMRMFLKFDKANTRRYEVNGWDCEDFSRDLINNAKKWMPRLAIGEVRSFMFGGGKHSFVWFISDKSDIYFIEPQNDMVYKVFPGMKKAYRVEI